MGQIASILGQSYDYITNPGAPAQPMAGGLDAILAALQQSKAPRGGGMGRGSLPATPGSIDELLWQVPDHYDHLHLGDADLPLQRIARKLTNKGLTVSELEGFGGQGPITSGHATNSMHYSGNALDANWNNPSSGFASRFNNETDALDWVYRWLSRKYG